jgi:CRP-like cAMP-binding protein
LNLQERGNLLRARAVFGKVAVLYDVPQMFTVRTLEVCELLKLDKAALTRILKAYPEDNRQMLANLHQVSGAAGASS